MSIFSAKTVDGILSPVVEAIKALIVHADEQEGKATVKEDQINVLRAEVQQHDTEANRARLVADRLGNLIAGA